MSKPPYRVPTMTEIREMPWNGLNVVSTFAGAGGSSTGYRMAGCKVLYANEFIPAAADTYRANARPGTIVDQTDIRQVTGDKILNAVGLDVGELDIFDGSPPCSAFSTAGKREAGWGKAKAYSDGAVQVVDDLFYEYARLVRELRPKVFVAENVSGLVKGTAKGYFKRILAALREPGYRVEARLLDAQWLGVPQARQRLIFVGVREDVAWAPAFPGPMGHRYNVADVLPNLEMQGTAPGFGTTEYAPTDRPSPTIGATPNLGNARSPASHVVEAFPKPLPYRYAVRDVLPHIVRVQTRPHGFTGGDLDLTHPAPTVLTGPNGGSWYGHAVHDVGMVHDTSGDRSIGDVTDRPSPTVVANPMASYHLRIVDQFVGQADPEDEGDTVRRYVDPTGKRDPYLRHVPSSEPSLTVAAQGLGAAFHGQFGMTSAIPEGNEPPWPGPEWRDGEPYCPETGQALRVDVKAGKGVYTPPPGKILRRLTIPELRIICSFPPDFVLTGNYQQRWERCGRAVPPLMMRAIASTIAREVFGCAG